MRLKLYNSKFLKYFNEMTNMRGVDEVICTFFIRLFCIYVVIFWTRLQTIFVNLLFYSKNFTNVMMHLICFAEYVAFFIQKTAI